jgi:hypothetical protein
MRCTICGFDMGDIEINLVTCTNCGSLYLYSSILEEFQHLSDAWMQQMGRVRYCNKIGERPVVVVLQEDVDEIQNLLENIFTPLIRYSPEKETIDILKDALKTCRDSAGTIRKILVHTSKVSVKPEEKL